MELLLSLLLLVTFLERNSQTGRVFILSPCILRLRIDIEHRYDGVQNEVFGIFYIVCGTLAFGK